MTTIKATCPTCGEVELTPDDIELRVCNQASASSYLFECPVCISVVRKPADDRVIQLLISGGVHAVVWEYEETSEHPDGPQFTLDDMIDFHQLLESPDWFDRLSKVAS
ncbi:MAG: hypothetical protein ACYDCC_05030 [Actinomycetota bacterium]